MLNEIILFWDDELYIDTNDLLFFLISYETIDKFDKLQIFIFVKLVKRNDDKIRVKKSFKIIHYKKSYINYVSVHVQLSWNNSRFLELQF